MCLETTRDAMDLEPEIDIFYIDIGTLSAYDLVEFLTINNKSHKVRCSSFDALQKRAKQFASKGPDGKFGVPYYLYRYETNPPTEDGRDWRISPSKSKYWGQEDVDRVHAKTNFMEVVKQGINTANIHTLDEDWEYLPSTQQRLLYKIAKGNYGLELTENTAYIQHPRSFS